MHGRLAIAQLVATGSTGLSVRTRYHSHTYIRKVIGPVPILVVQNNTHAPAGLIGECIAVRGHDTSVVTPIAGDPLPHDGTEFDGLVVLGGPQSAMDDETSPYFPALLDLIRTFAETGRPVLGICLGAQLIARAYGRTVHPNATPEIGYRPVALTDAGCRDPLFRGLQPERRLLQWHYDTFDLPAGAHLLATGSDCRNQAFRLGECVYAFQFHLEATPAIVRRWIGNYAASNVPHVAAFAATAEAEIADCYQRAASFAWIVGHRWVDMVENRSTVGGCNTSRIRRVG